MRAGTIVSQYNPAVRNVPVCEAPEDATALWARKHPKYVSVHPVQFVEGDGPIYFDELPAAAQKEHKNDYDGVEQAAFFEYRQMDGTVDYILAENFNHCDRSLAGRRVDGGYADTFFSAYFVRYIYEYGSIKGYAIWVECC